MAIIETYEVGKTGIEGAPYTAVTAADINNEIKKLKEKYRKVYISVDAGKMPELEISHAQLKRLMSDMEKVGRYLVPNYDDSNDGLNVYIYIHDTGVADIKICF